MATTTVPSTSFPAQPLTITSEQISRYAELASLVSQLEAQQKSLRAELLTLRAAGAEQETDSPYLLAFVDQERRTVDWKTQAFRLLILPLHDWAVEAILDRLGEALETGKVPERTARQPPAAYLRFLRLGRREANRRPDVRQAA